MNEDMDRSGGDKLENHSAEPPGALETRLFVVGLSGLTVIASIVAWVAVN
ncbi:hypothetical protein [Williamsia muralis]|nr:hypothetical protein [Williamsia marianensis]